MVMMIDAHGYATDIELIENGTGDQRKNGVALAGPNGLRMDAPPTSNQQKKKKE